MKAEEAPFPASWWGTGMASAGVAARPDVGTYGKYSFAELPPLPFALSGDFGWLREQEAHDQWAINDDGGTEQELPLLRSACEAAGLALPDSFVRFMSDPHLQQRVRSSTACYLDLDVGPAPSPTGKGHLVRFLADQQGCLFWYLYLTEDGSGHAVVCTVDLYEHGGEPAGDPDEIEFCAESFEAFVCRYWLENEIFFAGDDEDELPAVAADYLSLYRA
ncbi:hypothetical protein [Actinoplanes philippinensis]|uniref:hypothetical protein n=1 Tax=Actinoplanes philippinensis TaxID=35752 RepID=UPI0033C5396D